MEISFNEDLKSLIANVPEKLTAVKPIAGLTGRCLNASAYRLEFSGGKILKGREFVPKDHGRKLAKLMQLCPSKSFSRILHANPQAVIEEWVHGTPLNNNPIRTEWVRRCGQMMQNLHNIDCQDFDAIDGQNTEFLIKRMEESGRGLLDAGILTHNQFTLLRELALQHRPRKQCPFCIVHLDFCPENIVLRESEELCVIDNATMKPGLPVHDLARIWYRWPMSDRLWQEFIKAYDRKDVISSFVEQFPFWSTMTLMRSVDLRRKIGSRKISVPLQRLFSLMSSWQQGQPMNRYNNTYQP